MKTKIGKLAIATFVAAATIVSYAQSTDEEIITLDSYVVQGMEDFASRAVEGETPVSFSTVDKEDIVGKLGSRDIPLVLDTTPSVYATAQGGGAGDARINIRGFDQRNIAVMINGIPQNDMENGWVYWSNWDGVGDAAASIQVQRGMSNVNLATPSVGGTLNIITDPAGQNMGGSFRQEFGTGNFLKSTIHASTGLMLDDKFALSATIVRKTGDDYNGIDKTWTDAWAYYFDASYIINETNRLQLTVLGAPQRHGQNLYEHNVAEYDQGFARKIGADPASFDRYPEQGRTWNENWSPITAAYQGKQYFNGSTHDRYSDTFMPERENYFHKPVASLTWAMEASEELNWTTSLYWSGGEGGGTGTYYVKYAPYGSDFSKYPFGYQLSFDGSRPGFGAYSYDAQANYEQNISNPLGNSTSILRNSVNEQNSLGVISKATYEASDELTFEVGADWRTASVNHFREVRDLLGGQFFYESNDVNDFWQNNYGFTKRGLGDKIDYNTNNTIDWLGLYAQGEYKTDALTVFGMAGWSTIEYGHENYFKSTNGGPTGDTVKIDADSIDGYQLKTGLRYSFTEELDGYVNLGYYDKVPNLDGVINDSSSILNPDPQNEKITSAELGINFNDASSKWAIDANVYYTSWEDRTVVRSVQISEDEYGLANLSGVNQDHMGVEIEGTYFASEQLRFDAAVGVGNWEFTGDASGSIQEYGGDPVSYDYYLDGLKVGDQPQKQVILQTTWMPFDGFSFNVTGKWNGDMYANFDPTDRTDSDDRTQSWKTPSYWVFDAHLNWNTSIDTPWAPLDVTFFIHVFNVVDEIYIAEATDNDGYNAFDFDHDADDAGVYLGVPRNWNTGFSIRW